MTRHARLALLAVIAALGACSSTAGAPPVPSVSADLPPAERSSTSPSASTSPGSAASATRTSEGGEVTVIAIWPGPGAGAAIDVTLDTHSVELDGLDLTDAVLRNDRRETLAANPWDAPLGGHHREGMLTFVGDAASFLAGAEWIELVFTGIGDLPERSLRWDVGE